MDMSLVAQIILAAEELGLQYVPKFVDTSKKQQFEPEFVVSPTLRQPLLLAHPCRHASPGPRPRAVA